jgi:HEAT repeat protein
MDQMKTPARAIRFAFDQGIGFLPYGGYGMEALHAWKKRSTAPTRAAAARELASDPDPRSGQALAKILDDKNWTVRAAAVEAIAKRGDPALLTDIVPIMSDKKDIVRYSASAAVIRLTRLAQEKTSPAN